VKSDDIGNRDRLVEFATAVAFAYRDAIRRQSISMAEMLDVIEKEEYDLNKLIVFTAQVKRLPICGSNEPPTHPQ